MSATQELIAAALTEYDLMTGMLGYEPASLRDLREACARAMVQPAAPDMAEVGQLLNLYDTAWLFGSSDDLEDSRTALLDYVRGVMAERDALMLEFCPQEMTEVQKEKWARNQQPVSAAEVPTPEPAAYLSDNGLWCNEPLSLRDEPAFLSGEMQQYGDAREAAGYARKIAALDALLAQIDVCRRDGFIDTPGDTAAFCISEGAWIELVSCAEKAALRGEVKP